MGNEAPRPKSFFRLREAWTLLTSERLQRRVTIAMLLATFLLLTWKYYGTQTFFIAHITMVVPAAAHWDDVILQTCAELYRFGAFVLLCGIIPWSLVRLGYRESLAQYGVTLGHTPEQRQDTWRLVLILTPIFILIGIASAWDPVLQAEFPFNRHACDSGSLFAIHTMGYLAYYVAWEFFFRGFLQRTLSHSCGVATAILVQTALSTMVHLGGPASETYSAIGGGLLWGLCAWRTNSLLPGLAMHACMGISLDAAIGFLSHS